ncbi:MAG: YraN family protein [Atopobiaceae bacterium]|nr:YraN family protein [Atopobiaceae bacterium]
MKRIGQEGERVAAKFLEQLGFTILERNWMRAGREADIIAFRDETVVFVEVKTTVASPYDPDVMPELRVDDRKKAKYRTIAGMYLQAHPGYPNARFDVIAVNLVEPGHSRLVHLEGAFTCDQI